MEISQRYPFTQVIHTDKKILLPQEYLINQFNHILSFSSKKVLEFAGLQPFSSGRLFSFHTIGTEQNRTEREREREVKNASGLSSFAVFSGELCVD
jgi:hypothetical protein